MLPDGRLVEADAGIEDLLGWTVSGFGDRNVFDLLHPDDLERSALSWEKTVSYPGARIPIDLRLARADGTWCHVELVAENRVDDPDVAGLVVHVHERADVGEADTLVRGQSQILELIARGAPVETTMVALAELIEANAGGARSCIMLVDDDGAALHPVAAPSLPATFVDALRAVPVGPDSLSCGAAVHRAQAVVAVDVDSDPLWAGHRELAAAHGIRACWSAPVMDIGGGAPLATIDTYHAEPGEPAPAYVRLINLCLHLAALAIDRHRAVAELAHQATHDPLTGLPNRALFLDRLETALARRRADDSSVAVLFLDLDRFKVINDSLGHEAGDLLLVAVAARLSDLLRPGDTVARFGGDEFTVLCDDVGGVVDAVAIAERIVDGLALPLLLPDGDAFVTTSVGIALGGPGGRPETLLRDADAAMYRAKERGRSRIEVFDAAMRAQVVERMETEKALHLALERDELVLHYQPEVHVDDLRPWGVEALVRWQHPERGLLAPVSFIPLAEETGQIIPLGDWVLAEACRQSVRWGPDAPVVWVNLSAPQLSDPGLVGRVSAILATTGARPDGIGLELTESAVMGDAELSVRTLRALKALGLHLAIDDFGTGYSSLEYLKRFPVDVVKVDGSFVAGLGRDAEDSAIVTAVVGLAHALGLLALAEGVETECQLAELRRLGCDLAQGYLFARPAAAIVAPPALTH